MTLGDITVARAMSLSVIDYDPRPWADGSRTHAAASQQAALELFAEQGFERTTVEDIADAGRAHERTFFRHFADKREVLFAGGEEFQATVRGRPRRRARLRDAASRRSR